MSTSGAPARPPMGGLPGKGFAIVDKSAAGPAGRALPLPHACRALSESRIPRPRSPRRHGERGYTLIEVIVAFAILALGLTLLLGTLTGATRQVRWADDAGRASLYAQSLLDDTGVGTTLQPGQRNGSFEDGRYRWSLAITPYHDPLLPPQVAQDLGAPGLLQLVLIVQWGEGNDPRRRLEVQSLRLVTPNPLDAAAP